MIQQASGHCIALQAVATGALVMQCAIEPTLEGSQPFVNTGWVRNALALERYRAGLRHSEPHSSPTVIEALCTWLRTIVH